MTVIESKPLAKGGEAQGGREGRGSFASFVSSSIGKKQVVAATGLLLIGFLIAHLAGNLLIFAGPEKFNAYSHGLITNPLIIPAEVVLAAVFLVHIAFAVRVSAENRRARGAVGYVVVRSRGRPSRRSLASQTMIVTGVWTLVFLVTHLITFKFGTWYEVTHGGVIMRDLHRLVLEAFASPLYVAWYVASMIVLGFHLHHGVSSLFQTFGIDHPRWTPLIRKGGFVFAWTVAFGYILIPLWCYFSGART